MSNLHKDLAEDKLHNSKGFTTASNNTIESKNEKGLLEWQSNLVLPSCLRLAISTALPPTTVNGDVYILDDAAGKLDVNTIVWQSGTTVRYTFNSSPDLSAYAVGDYLKVVTAANGNNNGTFVISAVDNTAKHIDVTNALRTSATGDEATNSPAVGSVTDIGWTGAGQNDWVRYDSATETWKVINPSAGMRCWDKQTLSELTFDGTTWIGVGATLRRVKVILTSAQILSLFSSPKSAIVAPSGGPIDIISVFGLNSFNSAAYSGNAVRLRYVGGADIATFSDVFTTTTTSRYEKANMLSNYVALEGTGVEIYVPTANPTLGDGTMRFEIIYRYVNM